MSSLGMELGRDTHSQPLCGGVSQHLHAVTCTSIKVILRTKDDRTPEISLRQATLKNTGNAMCGQRHSALKALAHLRLTRRMDKYPQGGLRWGSRQHCS